MIAPDIQSRDRQILASMLSNEGTLATVLYCIAVHEFGSEVHDWEPETIHMEVEDSFGVSMPPVNHDKLMAIISAVSTDSFYKTWSAFELICRAISSGDILSGDDILVAEMSWGITEVLLCDDTPSEFSDEIKAGVGAVLADEGFVNPPAKLAFAKMPEIYIGSATPGDLGRRQSASTDHAAVVSEFMLEQSALLVRQLGALPWNGPEKMQQILADISGLNG